jgi:archaetidylinositol phosphate synthase
MKFMDKKINSKFKLRIDEICVLPLAKRINVNPNYITFISILLMLIASFFMIQKNLILSALFVFLSGYFDMLDGVVAKLRTKKSTKFGAFVDRVADRICDSLIISSIIVAGYVEVFFGIFTLVIILTASYTSSVFESLTKSNVGEALSLRGLRLLIITIGFLFSMPYFAMVSLLVVGIYSFTERFYRAWIDLK